MLWLPVHTRRPPTVDPCELGLFLPCLSYSVGQQRGHLRTTESPSVLIPSPAGARAPKKHSCLASLHSGPSQNDGGARGLILSAWDVLWTLPLPAFPASLRKMGKKLPALYLARGFALKTKCSSGCGHYVVMFAREGQSTKIQTNATENKVTIVMENVGYLAKHGKKAFSGSFKGRSPGVKRCYDAPVRNSRYVHQLRVFEKVGETDIFHDLPPSSDCSKCS